MSARRLLPRIAFLLLEVRREVGATLAVKLTGVLRFLEALVGNLPALEWWAL